MLNDVVENNRVPHICHLLTMRETLLAKFIDIFLYDKKCLTVPVKIFKRSYC